MQATYFFLALYSVCMIVLVVLWLQSGLDKVFNYKDNYEWLNGHFSKSALRAMVKPMLITLTIFEVSAGVAALGAIINVWFFKDWYFPFTACFLSMLSLASLFFGQRLAKDYGGAASLLGYMAYTVLLIFFTVILYFYIISTAPELENLTHLTAH
jgi:hypothetical protein